MNTLSAHEAADELGVSVSTIYAYVSRGLIRSVWSDGERREKRYSADDIERLKRQRDGRRDSRRATAPGDQPIPTLETAITRVEGGRIHYRGEEVTSLARNRSVGEVAALLWLGDVKSSSTLFANRVRIPASWKAIADGLDELAPVERFHIVLQLAADSDRSAWDIRPGPAARTGAAILQILTESVAGKCFEATTGISDALRAAWAPSNKRAADLIRAALILTADHQADLATLTARAIAAAGATPYSVVSGALCAFRGVRLGGTVGRIEALLAEVARPADAGIALRDRLERGETIPGFGHPLYTHGDPRAAFLLGQLDASAKGAREYTRIKRVIEAADELLDERPTIEFALVALAHSLQFPEDAATTLLALGRTIGWIAHAIEEYESAQLAAPTHHYVGIMP